MISQQQDLEYCPLCNFQMSRRHSRSDQFVMRDDKNSEGENLPTMEFKCASNNPDNPPKNLTGVQSQDEDTVCQWIAQSYGEVNRDYHEAYCKEIFRQIRTQLPAASISQNGGKLKAWF